MATAVINPDFRDELLLPLQELGFDVLPVPECTAVHPALKGHPDLQLTLIEDTVVCRPDMPESFLEKLPSSISVIRGETILGCDYPRDVAYNIKIAGKFAFHRFDYCDPVVVKILNEHNIECVHIKQGYAGCSIFVLPDNSIVSADRKAVGKARGLGMGVCLIEPGGIDLPGFEYGFIGGSVGVHNDHVYFTGCLDGHPSQESIMEKIHRSGARVFFLTNHKIFDSGGVFLFD